MKTTFYSIVMNYFSYLVTDYGFIVKKMDEGDPGILPDGRIDFETHSTFVMVFSDRGAAGATIGRVVDNRYRYFLDPVRIHEYLTLGDSDRKLLHSLDPNDDSRAETMLRQTRVTHKIDPAHPFGDIETQLADYSRWLRRYAEPFLKGDFSQWLEIYEHTVLSSRAAHIRAGKEEFVRTVSEDPDKRSSIFRRDFEYLDRLRQEYGIR